MRRRRLVGLVITAALAIGAPVAASPVAASADERASVTTARTCSSGYRHAVLPSGHRCLRRGQFCARRYDRYYHRYGFHCHRYYGGGYRLT